MAPDLPVATMSEQVGCLDAFSVARQSTAIHGMTPTAYGGQRKG